jgi:hypothetical protein
MFLLSCILFLALGLPASTSDNGDPIDIEKLEEVEVDLVLIDALVLDRKGRTVPGLTRDDFEVVVDRVIRPIDTLDELCDAGAATTRGECGTRQKEHLSKHLMPAGRLSWRSTICT